jgi:hypothetical protein
MSNKEIISGIKEFKKKHPDFWLKFESDRTLKPRKKRQFKEHLKMFRGGDITAYAQEFFLKNQLCGKKIKPPHEILGFVRDKEAFIDRVMEVTQWSEEKTKEFLRDWSSVGNDQGEILSTLSGLFGEKTITEYIMWSYRNTTKGNDPFCGIDPQSLPCRLGLPSFLEGGCNHYAFGHLLPSNSRTCKPTCFDSNLCEHWIPGGMTKPHKACITKYPKGLPELVHLPNKFKNIKTNLIECFYDSSTI